MNSLRTDNIAPAHERAHAASSLERLKGVILLEGSVRGSDLAEGTGRSVLDLPIVPGMTLLDRWQQQVSDLSAMLEIPNLSCSLLMSHESRLPELKDSHRAPIIRVVRDSSEFRGTGGALRDFILAQKQDDDALFLVASARQLLLEPLCELALHLARSGGDVAIAAYDDGSPSNLCLLKSVTLRQLPSNGLVDFKDKGLATIAGRHTVTVLRRARGMAAPLRTLEEYIAALQSFHRSRSGAEGHPPAFAERWASTFSIVEPGATVGDGARLHDSVILSGGHVQAGAVVIRSVVGGEGFVPANQRISGRLVNKAL